MPDTPRFDDPQHLVVAAIIDLYGRGLVPQNLTVQTMSIVVEFIREFDDRSLVPTWLAQNVHRLDPLVYRLTKSLLLELLDFDFFNSFVSSGLSQLCSKSTYRRLISPTSLLGGFFGDILQSFDQSDFDVRVIIWQNLCVYIQTFGDSAAAPPLASTHHAEANMDIEKQIMSLVEINDSFRAIDLIHKHSDTNPTDFAPLDSVLAVLQNGGYVRDAFATSESALTAARAMEYSDAIYDTVLRICSLMIRYPDSVPADFIGTFEELIQFLKSGPMATTFEVLAFELHHLVTQCAPLEVLIEKLTPLLASSSRAKPGESWSQFHYLSYRIWSNFGKTELAQLHLEMYFQHDNQSPDRFAALVQEAMYGSVEVQMAKLATMEPKAEQRLQLQYFKVARLILRVSQLTQQEKFSAAYQVLKVVYNFPMELGANWQFMIKLANLQLLLAQQKVQEVLELAQNHDGVSSPLTRKYMLIYSARALCESTQKIRRLEALELARQCLDCNSVPLHIEASFVEATALSMGDLQEVAEALKKCVELVPLTRSLKSRRLYLDTQILHTVCLLQLNLTDEAAKLFNQTQQEANREPTLTHARQLQEIRQELKKRNASGLGESVLDPNKTVPNDLKRKLGFIFDHRPYKRRSFFT